MNKFYNVNSSCSTLIIDWFLLTICNFKCQYCSTDFSDFGKKKHILTKQKIDYCLTIFNNINYNFEIFLLGGEPTLHKDINYIIQNLENISKCKEINLMTNGSTNLEKIIITPKLKFILSYHDNQLSKKNKKHVFYKNIKYLERTKNKHVHVMVENANIEKFKNIQNSFKEFSDLSYLYDFDLNNTNIIEFLPKDKKDFCLDKNNKKMYFSINEAIKFLSFKKWNCNLKSIIIDPDLNIRYKCNDAKKYKLSVNSLKPLTIKCTKEKCCYDDLLENEKFLQD